jgi:prepilin-type N-terminal cleavage/methylation domain-containing protein
LTNSSSKILIKTLRFTLIELLVVISILAILLSLLFPSLRSIVYQSENLICLNHMKTLAQGTFLYCDDNNDFYPGRAKGELISGRAPSIVTTKPHSSDTIRTPLYDSVGQYIGGRINPVFTCPLYQGKTMNAKYREVDGGPHVWCRGIGGQRGCTEHGTIHVEGKSSNYRSTYDFFGGLEATSYYSLGIPIVDRKRLGDPYVLRNDKGVHFDLDILWGDASITCTRRTSGSPSSFAEMYTTYHKPSPGTEWEIESKKGIIRGYLYVAGPMEVNYGYSDGSAKKIFLPYPDWNVHYSKKDSYYSDWHYLAIPGQPYLLLPKN